MHVARETFNKYTEDSRLLTLYSRLSCTYIDYLDQVNVIPNLEKDNSADQEISEQEASQEGRGITKIDKQAHHTSTVC